MVTGRSRTCSFSGRVKLKAMHSIPAVCALRQDIDQFWRDEARAHEDNCFSKNAPQVALGVYRRDECVFAQLGEEEDPWGHTSLERRAELNKRYKDKVEKLWAAGRWERPSPRLRPSPTGGRSGRCSAGRTSSTGTLLGCGVACPPRRNWKRCWIASTGWLCARLSLGFPVSRLIAVDMMEDGEIEER